MKRIIFLLSVICVSVLSAQEPVFEGSKVVCENGVCMLVPEGDDVSGDSSQPPASPRIAHGYMDADEFIAFLENRAEGSFFDGRSWWLVILLVVAGGMAMNLTPCVLPMIPVNLMIIGRSAAKGALYGCGMATAYGVLGVLAAVGGMAFGVIQSNPWFNTAVALLFFLLALSMFGFFQIDFSNGRSAFLGSERLKTWPWIFAFFMGAVSAVLAGACVAPVLIAVLLLTADLYAKGIYASLALPVLFGLGMALPWPFAGAGLKVLPRPGGWMVKINKFLAGFVLGLAAWYVHLAWVGFTHGGSGDGGLNMEGVVEVASPAQFELDSFKRPVVVDCWATWCRNCAAMDETTLSDRRVKEFLSRKGYTFVKLQAEDISELVKLPGFNQVKGLPAFLVFE